MADTPPETPETPNIINNQSTNTDKTFNRLKELQILLKKESALKELCKLKNKNKK